MFRRVITMLAALAALGALASPAAAQGVDETCQLALTRFDAATFNVLYPDDSAQYWSAAYQALPGTRIRIDGHFPHARYMSFNVYDATLRPLDAIADEDIAPDAGSTNPFVAKADRNAARRDYSVYVEFGARPTIPAPNTIYTGTGQNGQPNLSGVLTYRIYIPDKGRSETGDAGLPSVTIQPEGGARTGDSPCAQTSKPTVAGVNEAYANGNGTPQTETSGWPGRNPPVWRKFTNLFGALADNVTDSDQTDPLFELQRGLGLHEAGGNGGFLSNLHNAYVSAFVNRAYGRVLVTRFRPPTYPDTRLGAPRMARGQLRYWSVCENDPPTQRYIACLNDDRVAVGADGFATFVMSTPAERPPTTKPECGLNWLPWGSSARGLLILRHMLPADTFKAAIQRATFEKERETMNEYFPVSTYLDQKGIGALGCPGTLAAKAAIVRAAGRPAKACVYVLRIPRKLHARRARLYVDGRYSRTLRGRALRAPLRFSGVKRVRVVIVSRHGRLTGIRRTVHCR